MSMKVELTKNYLMSMLDTSHTLAASLFDAAGYPWDILEHIAHFITEIGPTLPENEYKKIGDGIWVANDAKIAPSAEIAGPCIIGHGTEIRHSAYIRGSAIIGDGCVVGNSTEVKNAVLFDKAQAPHFNYIGDSILGYHSHIGAGVICSNLKADSSNVVVRTSEGEAIPTGRRKFGAIVCDYGDVGCNSVLNPGTIICAHTNVYPLSCVRGVVPPNCIYKTGGVIVEKR